MSKQGKGKGMTFHVANVNKLLASLSKIVETVSSAHLTPLGSFIKRPSGESDLELDGAIASWMSGPCRVSVGRRRAF